MIELANLSFTYLGAEQPAIRDLSLRVAPGEVCGVLGRSGAGKSTLCTLLSGFMPQFYHGEATGKAAVAGHDLLALAPADLARTVALVLSDPFGQISGTRFSVFEEVAFGLENLGLPRDEILERAAEALDAVGIADLRDRSPYSLSGGQQQRLVLAAALAVRPQVLVLDQPAAQLDPQTVVELGEMLRRLADSGTTLVVAEARPDWLARLADTVLVLHEGVARAQGPADAVLRDPLLRELGIAHPRPLGLADALRQQGRWPADTPLPLTSDELLAGYTRHEEQSPRLRERSEQPQLLYAQGEPLVQVEDVSFRYPSGVEALQGVSLTIRRGERVSLLGRNGAGKSTLLRQLNGLLRPTSGRVLVAGRPTHQQTVAQCARTVALSFQDVRNQLFSRTVRQELAFGPRNLGYSPERCDALVEAAMAATGLTACADEHPYDLQPQQRRLVAIAAALAMATPLLVLDEPSAGMDDAGLLLLERSIAGRAQGGDSVLVVSHDLEFSATCTDRVLLMADGRLLVDTPWSDLSPDELALLDAEVGLPLHLRLDYPFSHNT